jgi:hypothetical protein
MECDSRVAGTVRTARGLAWLLASMIVVAAAGCSKDEKAMPAAAPVAAEAQAPPAGLVNRNGSQLAYEQDVRVRVASDRIATNLANTRDACLSQRFGACTLLGEELGAGEYPRGSLVMRAAPAAVAGLAGTASRGGDIAQRSARAEDLADAVRDNGLRRQRLELQHRKLGEILERRDLKPEDLFAVTERMSQFEAELTAAEQEAAQQQRRIATNLLTIQFESADITVASSRVGQALRGMTSTWDASVATIITVVGALLPMALLGLLAWWLVRAARRRFGAARPRG